MLLLTSLQSPYLGLLSLHMVLTTKNYLLGLITLCVTPGLVDWAAVFRLNGMHAYILGMFKQVVYVAFFSSQLT